MSVLQKHSQKSWLKWTPEMDDRLSSIYPSQGLIPAMQALGLSRSAVKNRVHKLKLRRPSRRWRPDEDAIIRNEYSQGTLAATIATQIGRGVISVRQRAAQLGVPNARRWTPAEIEVVRNRYRTDGAKSLAMELIGSGDIHSVMLVYRLAARLKVAVQPRHPTEAYGQIRALHAKGMNDSQIAKQMQGSFGFNGRNDRERVTAIRRRLKLPAIQMTPEQKRKNGQVGRQKQIDSGENPRNKAFRQFAEKYGLPGDTPPRAVEILLVLANGPKTREDLKQITGKDPVGLWNALGTSYLGGLYARGLVAKTALEGAAHRGPRVIYMLTASSIELLAKGKAR